jgi:hypothetical protein
MEQKLPAAVVLRDRDAKYGNGFDAALSVGGCEVKKVGIRAPNVNAYVERFVRSIERECLDRMIVFGREHLDYVAREYLEHYHAERPHQGMGNLPLTRNDRLDGVTNSGGAVVCRERLGGALRHYTRRVA